MSQLDPSLSSQARSAGATSSGEIPFSDNSLLYARTDDRGLITEGNDGFQKLSGYDWSELQGQPHKLLRHPDMPKGVFQLFWDTLNEGKQAAIYVKNKVKGGRFYWTFLVAWPVAGGFMSLRVKPHSDLFAKTKDIYAQMLAQENEGMNAKRSADLFSEKLRELEYSCYSTYISDALAFEISAWCRNSDLPEEQSITRFMTMSKTLVDIRHETADLMESFKAIRAVPMNMRIIASRLENSGGPISAISVNYGSMLDEMATWVKEFIEGENSTYGRISLAVMEGQFLAALSYLQSQFAHELTQAVTGGDGQGLDQTAFEQDAEKSKRAALDALKRVEIEVARLSRSVLDMKRYVTGLSSTRMMCKIESATLNQSGDSLVGIVEQLDSCQDEIEDRLAKIIELNTAIQSNTSMLRAIQSQ